METAEPESAPKSARRASNQHHSPGRVPTSEISTATRAQGPISEHGSNWQPAPPNHRTFHIPVVHGWNAPMPAEGDNPQNAWIEAALRGVAQKLARGLSHLMSLATKRLPDGRVLVHHEAIAEYITSSSYGDAYSIANVEQLVEALEQANVIVVHTFPPFTYGGDEQDYYEFLLEPLVQMDAGASNEMF